jgi:hypothetical protein
MAALLNMLPEQFAGPHVRPAGVGLHVPIAPAFVQVTHGPPVQALLQQTPPTQKPLWQPALVVQADPSAPPDTQVPPAQCSPVTHCPSFVQDVRHDAFMHK